MEKSDFDKKAREKLFEQRTRKAKNSATKIVKYIRRHYPSLKVELGNMHDLSYSRWLVEVHKKDRFVCEFNIRYGRDREPIEIDESFIQAEVEKGLKKLVV